MRHGYLLGAAALVVSCVLLIAAQPVPPSPEQQLETIQLSEPSELPPEYPIPHLRAIARILIVEDLIAGTRTIHETLAIFAALDELEPVPRRYTAYAPDPADEHPLRRVTEIVESFYRSNTWELTEAGEHVIACLTAQYSEPPSSSIDVSRAELLELLERAKVATDVERSGLPPFLRRR